MAERVVAPRILTRRVPAVAICKYGFIAVGGDLSQHYFVAIADGFAEEFHVARRGAANMGDRACRRMSPVAALESSSTGSAFTAAQATRRCLICANRPDIELRVVSFPPTNISVIASMKRCSSMSPNELQSAII